MNTSMGKGDEYETATGLGTSGFLNNSMHSKAAAWQAKVNGRSRKMTRRLERLPGFCKKGDGGEEGPTLNRRILFCFV